MPDEKTTHRDQAASRRQVVHDLAGPDSAKQACDHIMSALSARFGAGLGNVALAGYMPMRSEIDPLPIMRAHPGPVCVPVIAKLHAPLTFHRWTPDAAMVRGRFGADVPVACDPLVPDVLIVPLLAYDSRGYRLGYGGGFYDRTLAKLRAEREVLAIGLAYCAQQQPEVPTEPTDMRLDMIATEHGCLDFAV